MRGRSFAPIVGVLVLILLAGVLAPASPHSSAPPAFDPQPFSCSTYACLHPFAFNVSVLVTNGGASGTGTFQLKLTFPSLSYQAHLNGNDSNLYFLYANGTTVPSWIEANASNASSTTIVWLKLYNLAAGASETISALMAARGSFLWSVFGPIGTNPVLAFGTSWGEFDDGARVFNLYANFSGSSLPSGWAQHGGWSFHFNSGLWVTATTCLGCYIVSTTGFAAPAIGEFYGNILDTTGGAHSYAEGLGTSSYKGGANASYVGFNGGLSSDVCSAAAQTSTSSSGASCASTPYFTTPTNATWSTTFVSTSSASFAVNYATKTADAITTNLPTASTVPLMVASSSASSGTLTTGVYTAWIRERTYVATVPTVSYSTPSKLTGTVAISGELWLTPRNITVTWTAYSDPTAGVTNYTLYYGPSCQASNHSVSVGTSTSYTLRGVLPNVEYCVVVQAWVGSVASAPSAGSFFVGYGGWTFLYAPTGLAWTWVNQTTVALSWTNPYSLVTNDTVRRGSACGSWSSTTSTGGATSAIVVSGLTANTTYAFSVQAFNASAGSPLSSCLSVRTLAPLNTTVILHPHFNVTANVTNNNLVPFSTFVEAIFADAALTLVIVAVFTRIGVSTAEDEERDWERETG